MNGSTAIELSKELEARLEKAGVTDEVSLKRAFEADPTLRRDLTAFLEGHGKQFAEATIRMLMESLGGLPGGEPVGDFWGQVPLELENAFLVAAEARAAQAEQEGP